MNYLLIFFISIFTSAASACVGLGGGLLLIPFLILIFDLPIKYVAGTMLFAMVPYTAVATFRNLKQGYVYFKIGLVMEIGSILGVITGANFTTFVPDLILKILFLAMVIYLMLTLRIPNDSPFNLVARGFNKINFIKPYISCQTARRAYCSIPALILVGFIAGFFSGLLGVGGGFLKTPVLIVGIMLPPKTAVGTALFMIMITAFFGTVEHAFLGHIHFHIGIIIAGGMIIGAYIGTSVLKKTSEEKIKKYIFVALLVAAILALFR
ncbi:MAG: sulfite exporter TauE/SafE family protein [Calditrichota bacterium]